MQRALIACCLVLCLLLSVALPVNAQNPFAPLAHLFTPPLSYTVTYISKPPVIDGELNDVAWQQAAWTNAFQDIEGSAKPVPAYQTRVKMLWGDTCLYIAAQLQEPHVWATVKKHDDIIFNNNDFEVFINPANTTHQYFEIEVNALNTIFDLFLNKPYRNKGNAMIGWNAEGLKSAVKIQGTLNNPGDTDTGWTMEMAIPFSALSLGNNVQIPTDGTLWRINFSRVEWDHKITNGTYTRATDSAGRRRPEHNWVWSAQSVVNMHYPERWGYLQFSKTMLDNHPFQLPYTEKQRQYLWLIYYKQQAYFGKNKYYAASLKKLNISDVATIKDKKNRIILEATPHQFLGLIATANSGEYLAINQEGLIFTIKR